MLPEIVILKRLRLELDMTYAALATAVGVNNSSVMHRLLHEKAQPTERTLYKVRRFLAAHNAEPHKRRTRRAAEATDAA